MTKTAKGFALHSGALPPRSGIAILLESPGPEEPVFLVKELLGEVDRRRETYPELDARWVNVGAPVVGRAGTLMWNWICAPMGLMRADVAIFNTLHCYPGKTPDGTFAYPKGEIRKKAEATCASLWLGELMRWEPTISVVAMHPSAIARDVVPLPMVLRALERAKRFAASGERVLLLMGGKAAKNWLGYGENTTRWCGHWQRETEFTRRRREERWAKGRSLMVEKVKRVKKLTVKAALELLLSEFKAEVSNGEFLGYRYAGPLLSQTLIESMTALLAPKPKVSPCDIPQPEVTPVASDSQR